MPNFVKISHQMKKFPIQVLDSDCSVCMAVELSIPTNELLLSEKKKFAKFQIDSLKTEGLVCKYTCRQTDRQTDMAKSTQLIMLIIYVYIS